MTSTSSHYDCVLSSPLGRLGLRIENGHLCRLDYLPRNTPLKPAASPLARRVYKELQTYFSSPVARFSQPLTLDGTPFQQRVWQALKRIPPGKTLTYGELAARLGSGARAVGNACRHNPVSIIVPCHRVVGAAGIGGYSGQTRGREIHRKQWLLAHENAAFRP
ncbi:MAG: methylated-DNA--[protein]-cysteine S-methyltransferase [Gammaproteobacteria bacterium]